MKLKIQVTESLEMLEEIHRLEEKVAIYEEMMSPLRHFMVSTENTIVPNAIGLISHFPWYDFFRDWLCKLQLLGSSQEENKNIFLPLERCVANLIYEVPLPPPGKLEISVHLDGSTFYCSRPPVNSLGQLKNVVFLDIVFLLSRF